MSTIRSVICLTAVALFATASAHGAIVFNQDVLLGTAGTTGASAKGVKLAIVAPGEVDYIFIDGSNRPNYGHWSSTGGVAPAFEQFTGNPTVWDVVGASYDGGVLRVGVMDLSTDEMVEYTRTGPGTWTSTSTGIDSGSQLRKVGEYDVDPTTGLGGFIFRNAAADIVYVRETAPNTWTTASNFGAAGSSTLGTHGNIVYDAAGNAYIAYTQNTGGAGTGLTAGQLGSESLANTDAQSWNNHGLARANDGTLYLIDTGAGETRLWVSENNGASWTDKSQVIASSWAWVDSDYQIAVNSDESLIAALVYNGTQQMLATSTDGGATWMTQVLGGTTLVGLNDVAFDAADNLYVTYFDNTTEELRLLSTVPEPGSAGLSILGGLLCLMGRRRK